MNKIINNIIQTISIMIQKALASANFDRTIKAIILSCQDQNKGIYKIKYQDAIWKAQAINNNIIFTPGTSVYILIPANDMNQTKIILSNVINEL